MLNWNLFEASEWLLKVLDRRNSDHRAILLCSDSLDSGPKPFKIFDCWLDNSNLKKSLESQWQGSTGLNLHLKCKQLRHAVCLWNKRVNGDVDNNIKIAEQDQFDADEAGESAEVKSEISLRLQNLYSMKSSMLKQKARIAWNSEGDKNTKYFHKMVNFKWKRNLIQGISYQSNWLTDPGSNKRAFFDHFNSFSKARVNYDILKLGNLQLKSLVVWSRLHW